jgi:hypothetical protein
MPSRKGRATNAAQQLHAYKLGAPPVPIPVPVWPSLTVRTASPATGPRHRGWRRVVAAWVFGQQLCIALPDSLPPQVLLPLQVVLVRRKKTAGEGRRAQQQSRQWSDIAESVTHRESEEGWMYLGRAHAEHHSSSQCLHALARLHVALAGTRQTRIAKHQVGYAKHMLLETQAAH